MRQIKFRTWDREENAMIYDHYWSWFSDIYMPKPLNDSVLMQFTGLKDRNGLTDIYEDDIINSEGLVIGNKYQNYELLKKSTNFLIQGFGTEDWETTNKKAMERGCKYSKRYADKNEF